MAIILPLPEKAIKRRNDELLDLHKRVLKTYLVQQGVKVRTRQKFFKLYDYFISDENIMSFFFTPTRVLVRCLVLGEDLSRVSTFIPAKKHGTKKRRKTKA